QLFESRSPPSRRWGRGERHGAALPTSDRSGRTAPEEGNGASPAQAPPGKRGKGPPSHYSYANRHGMLPSHWGKARDGPIRSCAGPLDSRADGEYETKTLHVSRMARKLSSS